VNQIKCSRIFINKEEVLPPGLIAAVMAPTAEVTAILLPDLIAAAMVPIAEAMVILLPDLIAAAMVPIAEATAVLPPIAPLLMEADLQKENKCWLDVIVRASYIRR
jgi:hypothetical protein